MQPSPPGTRLPRKRHSFPENLLPYLYNTEAVVFLQPSFRPAPRKNETPSWATSSDAAQPNRFGSATWVSAQPGALSPVSGPCHQDDRAVAGLPTVPPRRLQVSDCRSRQACRSGRGPFPGAGRCGHGCASLSSWVSSAARPGKVFVFPLSSATFASAVVAVPSPKWASSALPLL